ncbi:activated protein kinase c receptor (LACK) [Leishmania tarentolae]|uniref:Activated protein kinase c receptor (LACK) n=1 Tax=Leishmania tarentolae TaxID=5689 RepID=A0A640KKS1_LEITA|nr:activated protein kinase c receptor (LACK) [Leishmania tarentolae]
MPSGTSDARPLLGVGDGPYADQVVLVAGVQSVAVGGPGNGDALGWLRAVRRQLRNHGLTLQVVHGQRLLRRDAHPEAVGREGDLVDGRLHVDLEQLLAGAQVPQECHAVLAAGRAQRPVRRHRHGGDVVAVALEGALALAPVHIPYLDGVVPAAGDHDRVLQRRREADAAHPVLVTVAQELVHAFARHVPDADHVVATRGHDQAVVRGEGDGEHVLGVLQELALALAIAQVPHADGAVPGRGQRVVGGVGQRHARHEAGVALQAVARQTVVAIHAMAVDVGLPRDGRAVARRGYHLDVRLCLLRAGQGGDPSAVALQVTLVVHGEAKWTEKKLICSTCVEEGWGVWMWAQKSEEIAKVVMREGVQEECASVCRCARESSGWARGGASETAATSGEYASPNGGAWSRVKHVTDGAMHTISRHSRVMADDDPSRMALV